MAGPVKAAKRRKLNNPEKELSEYLWARANIPQSNESGEEKETKRDWSVCYGLLNIYRCVFKGEFILSPRIHTSTNQRQHKKWSEESTKWNFRQELEWISHCKVQCCHKKFLLLWLPPATRVYVIGLFSKINIYKIAANPLRVCHVVWLGHF